MNDKTFIRAVNAQDSQAVRRLLPILSIEHLNQLHDSRTVHGEMAALHVAAYKGHSEIIDLLMQDSRVDLNLQTSKGYTALELAIDNSQLATTRQLLATQQVLYQLQ